MDPPPWRLPPGGPDPRLTCTPFSDGDQALLYDLFLRVVQDIAGADHVSSIPNFQILDCRDSDGSRCIFVRFGGNELTSGVGEDFASMVEAVTQGAVTAAPDPWDFEMPEGGYTSSSDR